MENWYPDFEKALVEELKGTNERDLRFFRIEEFFRNAERVDSLAGTCRECYSFRTRINEQKSTVAKAVQQPGKERRELDRLQSSMNDHMRKAHGYFPPYYHAYMQSVYWTVSLMGLAFLLTLVFPDIEKFVFYSPAFAIGVLTGQIVGGKKDRKIRATKKNL